MWNKSLVKRARVDGGDGEGDGTSQDIKASKFCCLSWVPANVSHWDVVLSLQAGAEQRVLTSYRLYNSADTVWPWEIHTDLGQTARHANTLTHTYFVFPFILSLGCSTTLSAIIEPNKQTNKPILYIIRQLLPVGRRINAKSFSFTSFLSEKREL